MKQKAILVGLVSLLFMALTPTQAQVPKEENPGAIQSLMAKKPVRSIVDVVADFITAVHTYTLTPTDGNLAAVQALQTESLSADTISDANKLPWKPFCVMGCMAAYTYWVVSVCNHNPECLFYANRDFGTCITGCGYPATLAGVEKWKVVGISMTDPNRVVLWNQKSGKKSRTAWFTNITHSQLNDLLEVSTGKQIR